MRNRAQHSAIVKSSWEVELYIESKSSKCKYCLYSMCVQEFLNRCICKPVSPGMSPLPTHTASVTDDSTYKRNHRECNPSIFSSARKSKAAISFSNLKRNPSQEKHTHETKTTNNHLNMYIWTSIQIYIYIYMRRHVCSPSCMIACIEEAVAQKVCSPTYCTIKSNKLQQNSNICTLCCDAQCRSLRCTPWPHYMQHAAIHHVMAWGLTHHLTSLQCKGASGADSRSNTSPPGPLPTAKGMPLHASCHSLGNVS